MTNIDRLMSLFKNTFGFSFDASTAGRRAYQLAELHQRSRNVDDASPSAFIPGVSPTDVAWVLDEASRDFFGNEFLLWLWFYLETQDDSFKLTDGSEVTVMLARTLTLECPRGQTGHETISHEGPTSLPEARRAIQSGKMPRKVGLTLVRHDLQYEFTLHAEIVGDRQRPLAAFGGGRRTSPAQRTRRPAAQPDRNARSAVRCVRAKSGFRRNGTRNWRKCRSGSNERNGRRRKPRGAGQLACEQYVYTHRTRRNEKFD